MDYIIESIKSVRNVSEDWLKDLFTIGNIGRVSGKFITRFEDLRADDGVTRVTGSDADKEARDYVVNRMRELGLKVYVDQVGNIFGRLEGSTDRTVMMGSHIDTVINGGMFDGVVGVIGALETIRRLKKEGFRNKRSIEVVVFTGEEGSAFPYGTLGSAVLTGKLSVEEAWALRNNEGVTLKDALKRIGYLGSINRGLDDVDYFVELHVEQGPILEANGIKIGIVDAIVGLTWIYLRLLGEQRHAGTTPMNLRKDPLVAASDIIRFVYQHAINLSAKYNRNIVGTVGKLTVYPNTINAIPGIVEMGIDIRDIDEDVLNKFKDEIINEVNSIKDIYGIHAEIKSIVSVQKPVKLSQEVVSTIENICNNMNIKYMHINSGAGHDTQNMASKVKAGMIFIPSHNGISHSPLEWTDPKDIEIGIEVLAETIKQLANK